MNRFTHIANALKAAYADAAAQWFFGAEHIHRHDNWNRIVAYPLGGSVRLPSFAAQGHRLANLRGPSESGARDDILWERRDEIAVGIWAANYTAAENRLHAMLVALADVIGSSDIDISNINTRWIRAENEDITSGGALVVLSFTTVFYVLASDPQVVANEAPIGEGAPHDPVEQIEIEHFQNDELIHTTTILGDS